MFPLNKARSIAIDIVNQLKPHCQVINIAGSIRREKLEVKDMEIVCVPNDIKVGGLDLFGEDNRQTIVDPEFYKVVRSLGVIEKGKPGGRYMKINLKSKMALDLFTPVPVDYWRIFAIRTGSSDYSHKVIAQAWLKNGWCGTSEGLRLKAECNPVLVNGKTIWSVNVDKPTLPPVWGSEQEFFKWIGVSYIHPTYRTI